MTLQSYARKPPFGPWSPRTREVPNKPAAHYFKVICKEASLWPALPKHEKSPKSDLHMTLKSYARKPSFAPSPRKREKSSFALHRRKREKSPKSELHMTVKSYCMEAPHTRKATPQEGCPNKENVFRKHVDVQIRSISSIFLLLSLHPYMDI